MKLIELIDELRGLASDHRWDTEIYIRYPSSCTRHEGTVPLLATKVTKGKIAGDKGYDIIIIE